MFKEALQGIVEKTDGAMAGLLMDSSGIPVESYAKDGSPFDIQAVGIEFGVLLGSIKRASEMLSAGATREVTIATERMVVVLRMLNETYFLALAMHPEGNFGKGRFLMRTAAPALLAEL